MPTDLAQEFDSLLTSPQFAVDPYSIGRQLRSEAPVYWCEPWAAGCFPVMTTSGRFTPTLTDSDPGAVSSRSSSTCRTRPGNNWLSCENTFQRACFIAIYRTTAVCETWSAWLLRHASSKVCALASRPWLMSCWMRSSPRGETDALLTIAGVSSALIVQCLLIPRWLSMVVTCDSSSTTLSAWAQSLRIFSSVI